MCENNYLLQIVSACEDKFHGKTRSNCIPMWQFREISLSIDLLVENTELQKLKDLLGPSEALAMIRPNMRPCPTVPCQSCMKRIGVNMKRKGQSKSCQ
ncbi:uncharacterized protein [Bemisia tabaci]|uniref:uncharacterized protein isoform X2 n=1 Tax=Bemisia tabaci TaxID=7038 RepID=UPI003B2831B0